MSVKKKALLFLVDALRYDVLRDPTAARMLAPNMARMIDRGFLVPVVANGQSTQFVMPSLFSLTYPLDYGGYNNGIRDRPKSMVESLTEAGIEAHLMTPGNQLGVTTGYDRGFTSVRTTTDYRTLLEQRLGRTLKYELDLWRKRVRSEAEIIAFLQREFALMLSTLVDGIARHDKSIWPRKLHRINGRIAAGCIQELELLRREPRVVLDKLAKIAPGVYWRLLGKRNVGRARLFVARTLTSLNWRSRNLIGAGTWFPFLPLGHRQTLTGDVMPAICRFIENAQDRAWYIHMHVMDLHDCRGINRPLHVLGRLRYLPRWLRARASGLTNRRFLYDSSAMYVDDQMGDLIDTLTRSGQMDDTLFMITADHGSQYAESPRPPQDVGLRMYYEHIDVPLIVVGAPTPPSREGVFDTMCISSTLLEMLGVPRHASFKGGSVFKPGRPATITESCGHGNADLARRDIYFAVTTATHRMIAVLSGDQLHVKFLFDRRVDPRELNNLAAAPDMQPVINEMIGHLHHERAELLALRNIKAAA